MPSSDQNINPARYQLIPRVLIFAMRPEAVCLIRLLPKNGKVTNWTGKYNGPGGHVERGEDISAAARRELSEETGLSAQVALVGTIMVDARGPAGIGLFIFRADTPAGELLASPEGLPEWVPFEQIKAYPLVEDVALILARMREMKPGQAPFSGHSFYDENDRLQVVFD